MLTLMNTQFHSLLTVVILFLLGLISPGPNFFVVVEATLNSGRAAGLVTGLGVATGDAVYASCGLFGVAQFIATGGRTMRVSSFSALCICYGSEYACSAVARLRARTQACPPFRTGRQGDISGVVW